jgi:hypothetical protein
VILARFFQRYESIAWILAGLVMIVIASHWIPNPAPAVQTSEYGLKCYTWDDVRIDCRVRHDSPELAPGIEGR